MATELNVFCVTSVNRGVRRRERSYVYGGPSCRLGKIIERKDIEDALSDSPRDHRTLNKGQGEMTVSNGRSTNLTSVPKESSQNLERSRFNASCDKNVSNPSDCQRSQTNDRVRVRLGELRESSFSISGEESVSKRISYVLLLGEFFCSVSFSARRVFQLGEFSWIFI